MENDRRVQELAEQKVRHVGRVSGHPGGARGVCSRSAGAGLVPNLMSNQARSSGGPRKVMHIEAQSFCCKENWWVEKNRKYFALSVVGDLKIHL